MNIKAAIAEVQQDIDEVNEWAESEYKKYFGDRLSKTTEVYSQLCEDGDKIKESDLEWILTTLPFELIAVSEQLSRIKTAQEVIKMHIKEKEEAAFNELDASTDLTVTAKRAAAKQAVAEDNLLVNVYANIAQRAEREMSYSRELIMSCKKIWDARRGAEVSPMGVPESTLPEYKFDVPGTYIK